MRTRGLCGAVLILALAVALTAAPSRADEETSEPEAGVPPLTFQDEALIERADGTLLFFYRTNFVPPAVLAARLEKTAKVPGVTFEPLERQNVLIMEGAPDSVELALEAAGYFDVAPPMVFVEAKFIEVTTSQDERAFPPANQEKEQGEVALKSDAIEALSSKGRTTILCKPSVLAAQGETSTVSSTVIRTHLRVQTADENNVRRAGSVQPTQVKLQVLPTHVGEDFVTLRLQLKLRDVLELTAQNPETGEAAPTEWDLDTSVTLTDGEALVLGGTYSTHITEEENEPKVLLHLPFASSPIPPQAKRVTKREIVVQLTPTIVRNATDLRVIVPPTEEELLRETDEK